ncbi:MAG: hypothetical protein ABR549_06005 [Mycobacteriales bacterium]
MTAPQPTPLTWRQIAARQDGVLARPQALAAGMTRGAWEWKLGRHWTRIGEGVAVTHSGTPTESQLRWAAVLHGGQGAALDGDIALVVRGVKRLLVVRYDVSVTPGRTISPVRVDGFCLKPHRIKHLQRWHSPVDGLPVVRIDLATLHAAAWAPSDREAERRLTLVVQQRKTKPANLRSVLLKQPRLRRRALLLEVLNDVEHGAHASSELDFLRFCRRHRLPEPDELQVKVRTGGVKYLDARYVKQKISVEVDGAHHMWAEQWDADTLRSVQLAVSTKGTGEQLIRITQGNMRHSGDERAGLLRQLLL